MASKKIPDCDPEIYAKGITVFVLASMSTNDIESWVRLLAVESGEPVDWHFVGGRACVRTTGDIGNVRTAIRKLTPILPPDAQTLEV